MHISGAARAVTPERPLTKNPVIGDPAHGSISYNITAGDSQEANLWEKPIMQFTRRDALLATGAAAITTAAITAPLAIKAAGVKAVLAGDPLIALEADLKEARAAGERVGALWNAASDKAGDWAFGWPMVDFENPAVDLMRGWLRRNGFGGTNENRVHLRAIKEFNRHTERLVYVGGEVLALRKAEGRERIHWWIKARRAQESAQEAVGLPQLNAQLDSYHERVDAIENRLWDTPAETLRGVLIRLREAHRDYVAVQCCDDERDFYAVAFGKVLSDFERLSGELPS